MKPANSDIRIMTHMTVGDLSRSTSAMKFGILDPMKNSTRIMVPAIIRSTFQLIAPGIDDSGRIPVTRRIAAAPNTI